MDSSIKTLVSRKYGFWFFQLVGWGIFLLYDLIINILPHKDLNFMHLAYWLLNLSIAFIITLLLRTLYKKFYYLWGNIFRKLLMIILFTVLAGLLWHILQNLIASLDYFNYASYFNNTLEFIPNRTLTVIIYNAWPLFVWSILYFLIKSRNEYLDEKEKAGQSQLLATEAQLRSLRYQINPHFLFNTLNSIQGLMYLDISMADKMVTELSEFLRYTLRYNDLIYVPLKNEIDMIEKYFYIEKIRFGDELKYTLRIDPQTRDLKILSFILQPLLENAVKHGMSHDPKGVEISIRSVLDGNWLKIQVVNNGKYEPKTVEKGTGLTNVRERLENAYPGSHDFQVFQQDDKVHAIIKIKIPK